MLRILWGLSGVGIQRVALQQWRRSSITGTDGFGAGAGGRRRSLTGTEMGAAGGTRRKSLTQDDLVALNRPADGADGGGGDSDAEIDDEDDAFTLLERAQARSEFFRGFDDDELRVLADNMAVMPFREGEVIMQKGEPSLAAAALARRVDDVAGAPGPERAQPGGKGGPEPGRRAAQRLVS